MSSSLGNSRLVVTFAAFDFLIVVSNARLLVRCALDSVHDVDEDRGCGARSARFGIGFEGIVVREISLRLL